MALVSDNIVHIITMGKTEAGLTAVAVSGASKQRISCIGGDDEPILKAVRSTSVPDSLQLHAVGRAPSK